MLLMFDGLKSLRDTSVETLHSKLQQLIIIFTIPCVSWGSRLEYEFGAEALYVVLNIFMMLVSSENEF